MATSSPVRMRAVEDARDGEAAEVVAVIEIGDQNLQRAGGVAFGRGNGLHDGFEQRLKFSPRLCHGRSSRCQLGVGVEHGKIELIFVGVEIDEEVVDLVQHFLRAGVGAVDLVDDHDRRQLGFERLAEHVTRLRQRAFAGVHQQHDAVHHLEGAFDFAAEIAVAGRIDDVDLHAVVEDRGVLGQDGDAALALEFVGVHDALDVSFVGAKDAALAEHGVDERGLAVVHVGDDGDVANTGSQKIFS